MITSMLHVVTDAATSRRGKFVTILLWLVVSIALTGIAPKLATLYDNNIGQSIPADADFKLLMLSSVLGQGQTCSQ